MRRRGMDSPVIKTVNSNQVETSVIGPSFYWWYLESPSQLKNIIFVTLKKINHYFSIIYLLQTLLSPWKKDVEETANASLQDRIKMLADNLISRLVGAVVRSFTIIAGIVILLISVVLALIIFVGWYLLPLLTISSFLYGIYLLL